jgi:4-hydroxybenzoate polyprenyltransferase
MPRLLELFLPALQLTRMALVFTALSNSFCALLLWGSHRGLLPSLGETSAKAFAICACIAGISMGLYGFGMSFNDIIDRRRDAMLAAHRPLPSGRIGVWAAQVICGMLAALALVSVLVLCRIEPAFYPLSLVLVIGTGVLISFYDLAGKYLVAPGLITLGMIRFFHAAVPAPGLPNVWHPLWLLNHVVIVSTLAYAWEQKRPALTRAHVWLVGFMLLAINGMCIGVIGARRGADGSVSGLMQGLGVDGRLWLPAAAAMAFVVVAMLISRFSRDRREAGSRLMLWGLLWLILYDAAFAASYVHGRAGLVLVGLLPLAWLSVRAMRWGSGLLAVTQAPRLRRSNRFASENG